MNLILFIKAWLGRSLWKRKITQWGLETTIILTDDKEDKLKFLVDNLAQIIDNKYYDKVIIICSKKMKSEYASKINMQKVEVIAMSSIEIDCILQYYDLQDISDNFVVFRTDEKSRNNDLMNLIELRGLKLDEVYMGAFFD